jgi:hypothetical protein
VVLHPIGQSDVGERRHGAALPLAAGQLVPVEQGKLDVLERRRPRQQVEALEDEPELLVPDPGEPVGFTLEISSPSSTYRPSVGRSMQPMMFISVVLPDPEAPMIATISPRSIRTETPFSTWRSTSPTW